MVHTDILQLSKVSSIHFIGIGGIGMSGLARLFLHEGKTVSGSDRASSQITDALLKEGATFFPSQESKNITGDIEMIVYTEAMSPDHEEMVAARELGVPMMNYFEALGIVANAYYLIAIAGAHGKTTTTAMLIDIFEEAGLDPSGIVGSLRAKTKSNYRPGKSKYFIAEACEYKRDFLSLRPDVLVITNIEHEHVDYYKNLEAVQVAFREFALQVREGGTVIVNFSDKNIAPILQGVTVSVIDYGEYVDPLRVLKVPGLHNQMNAAAAAAAAACVGIEKAVAHTALQNFTGTWRRFEYKGEVNGAKVYDDYGHHPTEIKATMQGARELYPDRKITLVYEPHTYSRTEELFTDFVSVLSQADTLYLLPIYAAREIDTKEVSSEMLITAIAPHNPRAFIVPDFDTVIEEIRRTATPGDLILVEGAGGITRVASELTK